MALVADCIFCKIITGEIPAEIVFRNENVVAFNDLNPEAPTHVLLVPTLHTENAVGVARNSPTITAALFLAADEIATQRGLSGYRTTLITVPKAIQMVALLGVQDLNLRTIEAAFASVNITVRGNEITLRGAHDDCSKLENLFNELMVVIRSGNVLNVDAVNRAIEMLDHKPVDHPAEVLSLNIVSNRGRTIRPKTANQKRYVEAIEDHTITFGIGPAGTGKTYLAMAKAVAALQAKKVNRIVLTRPAVEAGENLGFLPGTLSEKIDPYLRPLFDALLK